LQQRYAIGDLLGRDRVQRADNRRSRDRRKWKEEGEGGLLAWGDFGIGSRWGSGQRSKEGNV